MPPKKRRQPAQNNKENQDENSTPMIYDSLSIEPILNENLEKFQNDFTHEYQTCQKRIEDKLKDVHQEFDKFLQTHESQMKLARLLDQEMMRIHQGENGTKTSDSCQELMEKTTDLMNASSGETSRTKTYLIGELQQLPMIIGNQQQK